jgi:hypothetical protein
VKVHNIDSQTNWATWGSFRLAYEDDPVSMMRDVEADVLEMFGR